MLTASQNLQPKRIFTLNKRTLIALAFAVLADPSFANFPQCVEAPETDVSSSNSIYEIKMRDWGDKYTLLGTSKLIRVDTVEVFPVEVSFYYNDNPINYYFTGVVSEPFATETSNFVNGQASERFVFQQRGVHKIYASVLDEATISDIYYTCNIGDTTTCTSCCPSAGYKAYNSNSCNQALEYSEVENREILSVYREFIAHNLPSISVTTVTPTSSGVIVDMSYFVDSLSKRSRYGLSPAFSVSYQMVNQADPISASTTLNISTGKFSLPYRGEYDVPVTISDGSFVPSSSTFSVFNPFGPSCPTCGLIQ